MQKFPNQISRRSLFQRSLLPLSAGSVLLSSCKTFFKKSGQASSSKPTQTGSSLQTSAPPDLSGYSSPNTSSSMITNCDGVPVVDFSTLMQAQENLQPRYVFYGDSTSCMMVLALPKYQHGNLQSIILTLPSGRVLFQKGIYVPSDINDDTTLRPVIFDNIALSGERHLAILFKTACNNCTDGYVYQKYIIAEDILWQSTFLDKPVYNLSPSGLSAFMKGNEAFPQITYNINSDSGFILNQSTYDTTKDATIVVTGLNDFYVTDLFGTILANPGQSFNQIFRYPRFICYKLVNNLFYVRTFVRIA